MVSSYRSVTSPGASAWSNILARPRSMEFMNRAAFDEAPSCVERHVGCAPGDMLRPWLLGLLVMTSAAASCWTRSDVPQSATPASNARLVEVTMAEYFLEPREMVASP